MKKLTLLSVIILAMYTATAQIINIPADYPTIQEGINAASDGDTVLVTENTYYENIRFMGKAITVASQYIMDGDNNHIVNTIIDGSQPSDPDSASTVMFINGETTTSIINGFTITGGTGVIITTPYQARFGGGICTYNSGAKIINNKIINNTVTDPSLNSGGAGVGSTMEDGDYWVVIKNNTISNNFAAANALSAFGGGIYVSTNSIIENNIIQSNKCFNSGTQADGGGIEAEQLPGSTNSVTIINNTINNNELESDRTVGAGIMIIGSGTQILNNVISDNYNMATSFSLGAGIMSRDAINEITISNNIISNNSGTLSDNVNVGSGICILDAYDVEILISDNEIKSNAAKAGGGVYERSSHNLLFTNNIFKENTANRGAGLMIFHPEVKSFNNNSTRESYSPRFINNNFIGNSAADKGGAVLLDCETNLPVFLNCIFYENSAPLANDISYVGSSDPIVISYSDIDPNNISGSWTGEGNINVDPEFIDGDMLFHLSLTSPCKNEGVAYLEIDGIFYVAPPYDYDGEGRPDPLYNLVDIGADENWEIPSAPVALDPDPDSIGEDYFIARWQTTLLATGYSLDVAYDENFNQMVPGYDNLDIGTDTTTIVSGLEPLSYYYRVRGYNALYTSPNSNVIVVPVVSINEFTGENTDLSAHIFPNPASGTTSLIYSLPTVARVRICMYDLAGNKIRTLVDETQNKGEHSFQADLSLLPKGLYLVRMQAGNLSVIKKLVIM